MEQIILRYFSQNSLKIIIFLYKNSVVNLVHLFWNRIEYHFGLWLLYLDAWYLCVDWISCRVLMNIKLRGRQESNKLPILPLLVVLVIIENIIYISIAYAIHNLNLHMISTLCFVVWSFSKVERYVGVEFSSPYLPVYWLKWEYIILKLMTSNDYGNNDGVEVVDIEYGRRSLSNNDVWFLINIQCVCEMHQSHGTVNGNKSCILWDLNPRVRIHSNLSRAP